MSEIISIFISSILSMSAVIFFGEIIFNNNIIKKESIKKFIVVLLASSILHTILYICFDGTIKTILLCILYMLTLKIFNNISISKAIISSIIFYVLLIIPDLIALGFALYILKIDKEIFYSTIAGGIIANLSVSILMILLTYIIRKPLRKLINMNISTNKKLICISSLILIVLAIFFYNLIKTFEFNNDIAGFIIAIFALITIFFYVFKQKIDNNTITKKYDELLDIMKNYESDIEDQRTFIHETKNELSTIRSKIKDKESEKDIMKYIDSIIGDKVSGDMSKYSKFKYLPSNGLKGFFYYKFTEAERKGINVSVNISKQIENSFLGKLDTKDFKDLARILGVYLDNAIEASSISENKKLGIEIYLINENINIIISNTYANEINKEKIGNEKFSTKGEKRGHGLLLVKRILNESKIITSENEINSNLYIQKIRIKNIEK